MLLNEMLDRNVRTYPDKTAIVYHDIRHTFAEFGEKVNRFSNAMMDLGLRRGDRMVFLAKNCPEYLINLYGAFQAGIAVVPLNLRLQAKEVAYITDQSDAKIVVFSADFLDLVQKIKPDLKNVNHFVMMGDGEMPEGILSYEKLLVQASTEKPDVEIDERDVAIQMYTSGTTGLPKGALLTHRNLVVGAYMGVIAMQITFSGCSLIVAPMFHIAAAVFSLTTVLVGGTNVIKDQFDPEDVLKTFEKEKISHSFFAPIMFRMLLAVPGVKEYDYSSLHSLCFGGAPIDYALLLEVRRVFQCNLMQGFGQTEASPFVATMTQEEYREIAENPEMEYKLNAVGKEFPNIHLRIVDENDNNMPMGEAGEIIAKGDNVMIGYYKMPEATAETLRGGWLYTGDIGRLDQDGYLYMVDRKKDMIISGGENIYCQEVENVIIQIPEVREVAIIGKADEKWGEVPKAFICLMPGAEITEAQVIDFCRENIAHYKCPKEVAFVPDFPRNAAGKVLKTELRKAESGQ
jgi:acyl-CoA synthetase (AMP-forming)/AMP-acid ligase II